jgi:hypothetical protein
VSRFSINRIAAISITWFIAAMGFEKSVNNNTREPYEIGGPGL